MKKVEYLVAGAGVTGLAFMNALKDSSEALCVEKASEPGGYCKTIKQDGFVWDFSGHFFHFRIRRWSGFSLREWGKTKM